MFITTACSAFILLAVAFYIVWNGFHNQIPEWLPIAAVIGAMAAFYYQIWYGKMINKQAETDQQTAETAQIVAKLADSGDIPAEK